MYLSVFYFKVLHDMLYMQVKMPALHSAQYHEEVAPLLFALLMCHDDDVCRGWHEKNVCEHEGEQTEDNNTGGK